MTLCLLPVKKGEEEINVTEELVTFSQNALL